jgi:glycosyltransferase involved in cell wall biosynthesis
VNKLLNEYYANHIIAVSPATRDNLTEAGISSKKISVVMNGVAPVEATSPKERAALRASLCLQPDTFVFGILARIEDYKGHLYLIHAAKLLKERGYSNFRILVAGTGAFEEEVARAVVEMGVSDVVQLLGFRSDVPALLNILDVQLNTSYGTEATSMALLEGMSLGLPSIVSDYGGNPFVVTHEENGLIFPSQDSVALADAMARLMDEPNTVSAMKNRAREIFLARFTGQAFARNTEKVYLKVLKGAK